jgi:hypothetical protein
MGADLRGAALPGNTGARHAGAGTTRTGAEPAGPELPRTGRTGSGLNGNALSVNALSVNTRTRHARTGYTRTRTARARAGWAGIGRRHLDHTAQVAQHLLGGPADLAGNVPLLAYELGVDGGGGVRVVHGLASSGFCDMLRAASLRGAASSHRRGPGSRPAPRARASAAPARAPGPAREFAGGTHRSTEQ